MDILEYAYSYVNCSFHIPSWDILYFRLFRHVYYVFFFNKNHNKNEHIITTHR